MRLARHGDRLDDTRRGSNMAPGTMLSVKTVLNHESGIMFVNNRQMWADAHAVIFGVGG
jgi:hypothetical protein